MEIRLPPEKLTRLRKELAGWKDRKKCKKRELLSLIGLLSHTCKAIRSGRSFLRRLIDLSTVPKHLEHYVRLNIEARSDVKELIPIVIAGAIWGPLWHGATVLAQCDNMAVVHILNHGSSKNQDAMHLVRALAFITAKFIVATLVKGVHNTQADALSCDNLPLFRSLNPQANQEGTPVPQSLLDILILSKPDWTSKHWTDLWSTTFGVG